MNIVASGLTGFLGSWTLPLLIAGGHRVVCLHRSMSTMTRIKPFLQHESLTLFNIEKFPLEQAVTHSTDVVLHCATNYGRGEQDPRTIVDANIVLPLKMLCIAAERGVQCFVNTDTILDKRINMYALSKHQFAEWLELYGSIIPSYSVAFEHFYGGMDDPSKFTSMLLEKLVLGEGRVALTEGAQRRYFLHVSDAAAALATVVNFSGQNTTVGHRVVEVGGFSSIKIREFVEAAWCVAGRPSVALDFGAIPYREREVMDPRINLGFIRSLGWSPKVSLQRGLEQALGQQRRGQMTPAYEDLL